MTRTWIIDCDKWKRNIAISFWVLASIGLAYGLFAVYNLGMDQNWLDCYNSINFMTGVSHHVCEPNSIDPVLSMVMCVLVICNIANYSFIWKVLNDHYKWLAIKCKGDL